MRAISKGAEAASAVTKVSKRLQINVAIDETCSFTPGCATGTVVYGDFVDIEDASALLPAWKFP